MASNAAATSRERRTACSWLTSVVASLASVFACGLSAAAVLSGTASAASLNRVETGRPAVVSYLLQGQLVAGDAQRMRAAVSKLPAGTTVAVILDSPGGNLGEGLMLGAYFHQAKIATIVKGGGGICYSACALAFLGGRDSRTGEPMRMKMSGGKLGFHQFSRQNFDPLKIYTKVDYDEQVAQSQEVTRDIVRYLKLIGEDLSKLQLMLRASSDDMNVISNEECMRRGIGVLDEESGRLLDPRSQRQRVSSLN